jgi:rSAM/selenodomain-associated transferase 1
MRQGLIIFIRNPVLGQVKTRLAQTLGDVKALEAYHLMLAHTLAITQGLSCDKFLYYSGAPDITDEWPNDVFEKRMQANGDLGKKMSQAFSELFRQGYGQLVIIGSDCLDLEASHIDEAFKRLDVHPVVIGPSGDGGYYLLGMNSFLESLFVNKRWSTRAVFTQTVHDLEEAGMDYSTLQLLNDVDEAKDLPGYVLDRLDKKS